MGEEKVSLDYEKEYHKLQERIAKINEEQKHQLQESTKFYEQLLNQKEKEIEWYKSVINGILHI